MKPTTRVWLCLALVAIIAGIVVAAVVTITGESPVRSLNVMTGLSLPDETILVSERDTRRGFLGQGIVFREYVVPIEATTVWLAACPTHFSSIPLSESGIWPQVADRGYDGSTPVCVMSSESPSHQDIVVLGFGRVFQMLIER